MTEDLLPAELARLCGVSADTIRHYEKVGVLPAAHRGANGYRRYSREMVDRVRLVRRALSIGFSLEELARILRQRDDGAAPCRGVRALAETKLAELERRIVEMTALREELAKVVDEWDERLDATRDGEPARLLESISKGTHEDDQDSHHHARSRFRTHRRSG
ncbi:MAG TPA: heavy metal-responsive transcriptional regulator [Thermoanaerobaculia bacterium]